MINYLPDRKWQESGCVLLFYVKIMELVWSKLQEDKCKVVIGEYLSVFNNYIPLPKKNMKTIRYLFSILLICSFFNVFAQVEKIKPAPQGVTAKSIIEKYINTIGGKEKLAAVKSISQWGKSSIQGNDIMIVVHNAYPNKFYFEMSTPDITIQKQIFDGEKGIIIAMGNKMQMQGEQLEKMKNEAYIFKELQYLEDTTLLELMGIAQLENGAEAYKIKIVLSSGNPVFDYYDVSTGLKTMTVSKLETPEGKFEMVVTYKDYKPVKGLLFPYKIIQEVANQTLEMNITLITLNKVKDKIFRIE